MPYYLLHGFRWPRNAIRIHIILQNLEDAAAEWLVAPDTTQCLLDNFKETYPEIMKSLPNLRFVEQYDPSDLTEKSQPYAYVADVVHEVKLGVDVDEVRGQGIPPDQWSAILSLRDKLCEGVKVGWFAVVCEDEERLVNPPEDLQHTQNSFHQSHGSVGSRNISLRPSTASASTRATSYSNNHYSTNGASKVNGSAEMQERSNSISRGLKRVFGSKNIKKTTSMKDMKLSGAIGSSNSILASPSPPPVVPLPPPPITGVAR